MSEDGSGIGAATMAGYDQDNDGTVKCHSPTRVEGDNRAHGRIWESFLYSWDSQSPGLGTGRWSEAIRL